MPSVGQEIQFGRDNDGDRYVFYPFHGDHLKGELFKNERNMFAMFLHFQTLELHTPEMPHVQIFLNTEGGEVIIKPSTMEYLHNSLTDVSTLSIAMPMEDFTIISKAIGVEHLTMETTDGNRKSYINIPDDERPLIPQTAFKLLAVEFEED